MSADSGACGTTIFWKQVGHSICPPLVIESAVICWPQTGHAKLNSLMNYGGQSNLYTAPILSPLVIQTTQTTVTLSWSTNEPTTGQVYWSTNPIQSDEATGPNQMPYVSGTLALDAGGLQTNHMITVSNLQSGTVYHVFTRSTDASGDMTLTLDDTFRTNY